MADLRNFYANFRLKDGLGVNFMANLCKMAMLSVDIIHTLVLVASRLT